MSARKHTPAPKRKASGRNVSEGERHGIKIQYRLTEWESAELDRLARDAGVSHNAYATRVMRSHLGPEPPLRSTLEAARRERDECEEMRAERRGEEPRANWGD